MELQLQEELNSAITELIDLLSSIDEKKINTVPFAGSWTAGQLAQHMIISNSGFIEMMNGPVKETKRNPDQFVEEIKSDFLDFSTKMESPDSIKPPVDNYDKKELLDSLTDIREESDRAVKTADLTKTCILFQLPEFEYLTRLEAAHFMLYHTQRHIHQLKNMSLKLIERKNVSAH